MGSVVWNVNIVFLKLYITEELNNKFYNSQEIGLAKALLEVHPEHRVDIIMLSRSVTSVERTEMSDRLAIKVIPARGIGHHGMIDLSILKETGADLVHLLADNMLYAPNVIRYCNSHGIKCHLYIGTLFTDSKSWYKRAISRLLMIRNINAYKKVPVYAKTPKIMDTCKQYGIDAKFAPVGMSLEDTVLSVKSLQQVRDQYGLPLDKKLLLFVGRFEDYKHPFDAVELLKLMDDSYHLVMVGRGRLQSEIEDRLDSYDLKSRATILQDVPNKAMRDIFLSADYYINFNPDEIYGMAILEAMCHECPVFAITAPGPDYLLDDGENGFICNSVMDMADKIEGLSYDYDRYRSVQENARDKVLSSFIWNSTVQCFEDF